MSLKNNSGRNGNAPKKKAWLFIAGFFIAIIFLKAAKVAVDYTSSDNYCVSCHVHPHADNSWRLSSHFNNSSGSVTHCSECHLPPKGQGYLWAKARHGAVDIYGYFFKDSSEINWEAKKLADNAKSFVYEESCKECHQNLFPVSLSVDGSNAHLFYTISEDRQNCITCHLNVGHYDRNAINAHDTTFGITSSAPREVFSEATRVEKFENFTEKIPGSSVSFNMIALPGGKFKMGSPESEPMRKSDEGPVREITLSPFWMGEVEVTWDEYLAFFRATGSQGRTEGQVIKTGKTDAISGATPPWGAPDQGWGKASRPAITMSWHAATVYCQWLSKVTGKNYRLPTEAEWEYACRGGTETPYFFAGNPKKFTSGGFLKKIFGPDTSVISSYAVYRQNSNSKTQEPAFVKPNPFGLKNMAGNVAEFCLDFYSADSYKADTVSRVNPHGPVKGSEHVIRGGSFKSDAADLRSAARDVTKTRAWLVTDPQIPKSIWWYSDVIDVGFRVVCVPDTTIIK